MSRKGLVLSIGAACSVLLLALGCQQVAAPQPTPKAAETPAQKPAAATATPAKPVEKPVRGGTIRLAFTSEFGSLDPNTQTGQQPFHEIYEQLIEPVYKDASLTKEGLAKDWSIGSDGKSITFKLREGVKFHDGTDFDAAAVKFNVDRMRDRATASPFREYYEAVASVDVVDKLTPRLNLSRPDVLILARVAGGAGGLMVSPAAVQKYGKDYPRNPVGTGPFQFMEWVPGDHVTVKRFEGYWKKDKEGNQLPYLDRVVYQFITDATTAVANLRTGQVDWYPASTVGVPVEQRPLVKSDPNLTYDIKLPGIGTGITMNAKKPPLDNKALRQAIALAVDRQGMGDRLEAMVNSSIFYPVDKAFDDGKSGVFPARDLAKAKAKMAEAGYSAGGVKVKFTGQTTPEAVMAAQILKANLAEIGIEMEIEAVAGAAWNTKVRINWDYQIATSTTNTAVGDPGHYLAVQFHSRGSRNYFGPYSNPRFDELLDKALVTYDQKARAALYNEAVKELVEDAPFVSVYNANAFGGMSKKVRNYARTFDTFDRMREVWLAQ